MPRTASGKRMTPNPRECRIEARIWHGKGGAIHGDGPNSPGPAMRAIRAGAHPRDHPGRCIDCEHLGAAIGGSQRRAAAARSDVDQPVTGTNAEEVERATGEGKAQRLEYRFVCRNVIVPARWLLIWLKACREIHETSRRAGTRHVINVAGRRDRYEHRHFTI